MKNIYVYDTEIGKIAIVENGTSITNLYFYEENILSNVEMKETPLLKEAAKQVNEYLAGKRKVFNLPLTPNGTDFQKSVWKALTEIPFGEIRSYSEVARSIGNYKAARAVGMANNKNPILIIIPCHRVVGSNGSLTGYAGGLDVKARLLEMEKNESNLKTAIKKQLFTMSDETYKEFSSSLIPNANNILGVRLPDLRKLAKKISKEDWKSFIINCDSEYFEEIMLHGMILGYIKVDLQETLKYISEFIPKINNWSICDSFCNGLKFTKNNMDEVWKFIQPFLFSDEEYKIRFGVVMIIDFYINENYIDKILSLLDSINHEGYYVKMAIAWAVSICYAKFPAKTMIYLKNNNLDDFTYNKSIQKILDSLQVDKSDKLTIRNMKRR